jgi:tetratricopeptide (TPR) repeat protein
MDLQASLLRQLENKSLSLDQQAELCCQIAREYEDKGQYESAREAMNGLWQHIGERPNIEGLEQTVAAEVLMRVGVITSWIGSCNQIAEAQETAKNLISESLSLFESRQYGKKIAEAQTELALCYWRTGEYDEARIVLQGVLKQLPHRQRVESTGRPASRRRGMGRDSPARRAWYPHGNCAVV